MQYIICLYTTYTDNHRYIVLVYDTYVWPSPCIWPRHALQELCKASPVSADACEPWLWGYALVAAAVAAAVALCLLPCLWCAKGRSKGAVSGLRETARAPPESCRERWKAVRPAERETWP